MNLRILKKLSKRAAPLLARLGDRREVFASTPDWPGELSQKVEVRLGRPQPDYPLKGTMLIGGMSGYYEPEWSDETCWNALTGQVYWHFTEYNATYETLEPTRKIRTPREVLRAAQEMIAEASAR